MDAAKGVEAQGCAFGADPGSEDEVKEPGAAGPDDRGEPSWLLLGRLPEVTRPRRGAETRITAITGAGKDFDIARLPF